MIPRRLYLKNFMSYGEPQEICFRDAKLWALCGENGTGKSTVFDAITYALFDEHRLGKQHADKLIHQGEDQLYIEFDFSIGEDEYRIKRSQNQKGSATRQVMHLEGPNVPEPGKKSPQAIRETDTDDGFNHWVERVIGLNYSAFTSSVLLLQGKSDALLKAGPADRHRILTQIIDLDPYIRLFNRANEKFKTSEGHKKYIEEQLKNLAPVDEQDIRDLSDTIEKRQQERQQYHDRQLELTSQKVVAEYWHELCEKQQQVQEKLRALQELEIQEESLKQKSLRYHELYMALPHLNVIMHQQQQKLETQEQLDGLLAEQSDVLQQKKSVEDALQNIQQELKQKREQQQTLMRQIETLTQRRLELAPQVEQIRLFHNNQQECVSINEHLAIYTPDIDKRLSHTQQAVVDLNMTKQTLKLLEQFSSARKTWQQLSKELNQVVTHLSTASDQITSLYEQERQQITAWKACTENVTAAREPVTRCETQLEGVNERRENLKKVDGMKKCHYCGQELTAEHLDSEHQHLEEEKQSLETKLLDFRKTYKQTYLDEQRASKILQELQSTREQLQKDCNNLEQRKTFLVTKRQGEEAKAQDALVQLNTDNANKIGYDSANIAVLLEQSSYPTEQDMQALHSALSQEEVLKKQIVTLNAQIQQRDTLLQKRSFIEKELREIESRYSSERIKSIPRECEQISNKYEDVQHQSKELLQVLKSLEGEELQQRQAHETIDQHDRALNRQIDAAENRISSACYILNEHLQQLSSEWQSYASTIAFEQLSLLEQEKTQLTLAEQQFHLLSEERIQKQSYVHHIQRLNEDLSKISPEARRPVAEVEQDIVHFGTLYNEADEHISQLSTKRVTLEQLKQRHAALEKERKEQAHLCRLYKSLNTLLGPNSLQRYLLQQAEQSIVTYANETLDKISNGLLRMDLAKNVAKGNDAAKNSVKGSGALDLVVYNYAISSVQPLEVGLLSGSQQFRIAVSLALGIGKYAGGESHRVESVIIDEGFGSLDTQGRQDMIHVLQALRNELACIIVVSHHDEFFDEFENKYRMNLIEGSTKVGIM